MTESKIEFMKKEKQEYEDKIKSLYEKRRDFINKCFYNMSTGELEDLSENNIFYDHRFSEDFIAFFMKFHNLKWEKKNFLSKKRYPKQVKTLKTFYIDYERYGTYRNMGKALQWDNEYNEVVNFYYEYWLEKKEVLFMIKMCLYKFFEKYGNTDIKQRFKKLAGCDIRKKQISSDCIKTCEKCGSLNSIDSIYCNECGAKFN